MFDYGFKEGFLEDGSIVIFPTDTVFGLACRIYDDKAINRIYNLKNRDFNKQLSVLCSTLVSVNDLVVINERVLKLAHNFWPGPLTMVLPAQKKIYKTTNQKTIGVRIPNHSLALDLINKNGPLITTSVNKSGQKPLVDLKDIIKNFENKVDYIYKEYHTQYLNVSSTVIDLTGPEIKYIRIGTITKDQIEAVLNKKMEEVK